MRAQINPKKLADALREVVADANGRPWTTTWEDAFTHLANVVERDDQSEPAKQFWIGPFPWAGGACPLPREVRVSWAGGTTFFAHEKECDWARPGEFYYLADNPEGWIERPAGWVPPDEAWTLGLEWTIEWPVERGETEQLPRGMWDDPDGRLTITRIRFLPRPVAKPAGRVFSESIGLGASAKMQAVDRLSMAPPVWSERTTQEPSPIPADVRATVREALQGMLRRDQINTCCHDETERRGSIWEICLQCGAKWADDEGGRPEWQDPPEWALVEKAVAALDAVPAEKVEALPPGCEIFDGCALSLPSGAQFWPPADDLPTLRAALEAWLAELERQAADEAQ